MAVNPEGDEPMANPSPERDPLFSNAARQEDDASTELDAFQTLLSPLGGSDQVDTDFGQLLAQTALRAETARQGRRRLLRHLGMVALAALVLTAVVRLFAGDDPTNDPQPSNERLAIAPGTVLEEPGLYELDGARLVLLDGARAQFEGVESDQARIRLLRGQVGVTSTMGCQVQTTAGSLRVEAGEVRVTERRNREVEITVVGGAATFQGADTDLGAIETYLPATAQLRVQSLDEGGFRVGTPRLANTTARLAGLCEKFDYGRRDAKTEDLLIRRIVESAETSEDTYVLWSLLARADQAEETRARGQLEQRLIELVGMPENQKQSKLGTFDVAVWREHLRASW